MEILTYPIGVLIGLFPVVVDLGGDQKPAQLLLDGRPACTLSADSPSCLVDLGLDPRVHLLELDRSDNGRETPQRVRRWINKPGVGAELRVPGACDQQRRICDLTIQWGHPNRLDPLEVVVRLDGQVVHRGPIPLPSLRAAFPGPSAPQVVTVEAVFPDGRRATHARLLHAEHPESAEASLQAVPIRVSGRETSDLAAALDGIGSVVRAVERGDPDIVFVVEPHALQKVPALAREAQFRAARSRNLLLRSVSLQVIVADESLRRMDLFSGAEGRPGWLDALFLASRYATDRRIRTADAVAAAGYLLGGIPRPRAVVLVLADRKADDSSFSEEQARRYLSENLVPLIVWRVGGAGSPGWPEGRRLEEDHDLHDALVFLSQEVGKQSVAWLEGEVDWHRLESRLPSDVSLAGRVAFGSGANLAPAPAALAKEPSSMLPGRSVFALAVEPAEPRRLYAGTDAGLFRSSRAGEEWEAVTTENGLSVYGLAFAGAHDGTDLVIATSGRLARLLRSGWTAFPTAEILSVLSDPSDVKTLYAGFRGGVLKSVDAGLHWSDASRDLPRTFALSFAADPKRPGTVYAATAGDGVYRTTNRASSWKIRGEELQKTLVRSLAIDPADSEKIYAGTDAGVFVSKNAGRHWDIAGEGFPRTPVYALATDPRNPTVWAGTALGLFGSSDGGKTWKACGSISPRPVTALVIEPSKNELLVGTLGGGIQRVPLECDRSRD